MWIIELFCDLRKVMFYVLYSIDTNYWLTKSAISCFRDYDVDIPLLFHPINFSIKIFFYV